MNTSAILVAAVAAFILSYGYYTVLGPALANARGATAPPDDGRPPVWKLGVELLRNLVLASVVAYVISLAGASALGAIGIGALLWLGLSAVQWTGAVLWEKTPPAFAMIHAGDWLVKLVAIALIVGVWR